VTVVEKAKVVIFLATTCGVQAEDRKDNGTVVPNGANSTTSATPTPNTSTIPTAPVDRSAGKDPQAEKATNWYLPTSPLGTNPTHRPAKNWPYFVAAFFFVAIAIVVFAPAGPVRKYMRRHTK